MAATERNAIDDMIAEAKANIGTLGSSEAAVESTNGGGSAEPVEEVSIRRQSDQHIQGQAKSGLGEVA